MANDLLTERQFVQGGLVVVGLTLLLAWFTGMRGRLLVFAVILGAGIYVLFWLWLAQREKEVKGTGRKIKRDLLAELLEGKETLTEAQKRQWLDELLLAQQEDVSL